MRRRIALPKLARNVMGPASILDEVLWSAMRPRVALGIIAEEQARRRARRAAVLRWQRRVLHRVLDTQERLQ